MFAEIVGLVETADEIISRREKIKSYILKIFDRVSKGERIVAVIGTGGV